MNCRACIALAVLSIAAACSEPLVFPDWTLPVPESTPVFDYAWVPLDARTGTVELQRDLVLSEAFGRSLYQPSEVKVDAEGQIFVLDSGNHRLLVFDDTGEPLRSMGDEGQGPGQFQSARDFALLEDTALVYDGRSVRWSVFGGDGAHQSDHRVEDRIYPGDMRDAGGRLLIENADPAFIISGGEELPPKFYRIGFYGLDADFEPLVEFEYSFTMQWERDRSAGSVPLRAPFPLGALAGDVVYVSDGTEYQVLAYDLAGNVGWALRTDYVVPAISEEAKREVFAYLAEFVEGLAYTDFTWPERYAGIENLEVDGAGNLWVFPHTDRSPQAWRTAAGPVPVDVYSPEGLALFSGVIGVDAWDVAHGDAVYRVETDPATDEQVVARYRLMTPF